MEQYPINKEILDELSKIIEKSEKSRPPEQRLNPETLYRNIYNSTGTPETLKNIFEVSEHLIRKIIAIKVLKNDLTVPNTIKKQLFYLDTNAMMCWGSNSFTGTGPIDPYHNGSISFMIQNLRDFKKGSIQIDLNYKDLYNIKIYDSKHQEPIHKIEDIYNDMLIDYIGGCIGF